MRTVVRLVLPLLSLLVVLTGCSSEGTTPNCPSTSDCIESPKGGGYWVGNGGNGGNAGNGDDAEPEVEAGDDADQTD